jgi:D-alanyl-D-alanine carboxypeptidase (penicillin-binding protein 5/6)
MVTRCALACLGVLLALGAAPGVAQPSPSSAPDGGAASGVPAAAQAPGREAPLLPPLCKAQSAILVDFATGTVLWERNSRVRRPNASTTKIVTATVAIESGRLDDTIAFSENAIHTPYANLNAKPGEKIRLRELLYAMLLRSSNDACVAVGEHLFGSARAFAAAMTRRARELGALDTQFVTPNGLHDPGHFSTAYDLALLARHALQIPLFALTVATRKHWLERSINLKDRLLVNHNRLLARYSGADGVKTGYVKESGRCLVASCTRPENGKPWRLLAVVLNSRDVYGDSERLLDWGRKNFQPVYFARAGEEVTNAAVRAGTAAEVPLVAGADLLYPVRRSRAGRALRRVALDRELEAPIAQAQKVGRLQATLDGRVLSEVQLTTALEVPRSQLSVVLAGAAPATGISAFLGFLWLGPRYVRTITKAARRCRRRLSPRRGEPDRRREGNG